MERSRLSGFSLVAVLALFALPFLTFSCGGIEIATVTGYDLVLGGEVTADADFTGGEVEDESQPVDVEPLVVVALAAAVAGIVVAFAMKNARLAAALGAVGAIALFALQFTLSSDIDALEAEAEGLLSVGFGMGYWLSIAAFAAAAVLGFMPPRAPAAAPPPPSAA